MPIAFRSGRIRFLKVLPPELQAVAVTSPPLPPIFNFPLRDHFITREWVSRGASLVDFFAGPSFPSLWFFHSARGNAGSCKRLLLISVSRPLPEIVRAIDQIMLFSRKVGEHSLL